MSMPQPNIVPASGKATITPRAALISILRTWLLYRDEILWAFVSGTEADNPLEKITLGQEFEAHVAEANAACDRAWAMAEKIARDNEQKVSTVLREALNELLTHEVPSFLLSVTHIPGSF